MDEKDINYFKMLKIVKIMDIYNYKMIMGFNIRAISQQLRPKWSGTRKKAFFERVRSYWKYKKNAK